MKIKQIKEFIADFANNCGQYPMPKEIAQHFGMSVKEVLLLRIKVDGVQHQNRKTTYPLGKLTLI